MAATKVRRLIPNKDYTHSLIIKLQSSSLVPQLESSIRRFRKDAFAAEIPERAFIPLELANLSLGKMYLEGPQRREDFSKFLHSIEYRELLSPAPESAQSSFAATEQVDTARSRSHVAPLRINFSGLHTAAHDPSKAMELSLLAIDPTDRLQSFWRSLIDRFTLAGFPIVRPSPNSKWRCVSSVIANRSKSNPSIVLPNGERRHKNPLPKFDARELLKKYENTIWAKDVPLERLSLVAGIGFKGKNSDGETVWKQPAEIDSVALHDDRGVGSYSQ